MSKKDYNAMKATELKARLDQLGVSYKGNASKNELIQLLENAEEESVADKETKSENKEKSIEEIRAAYEEELRAREEAIRAEYEAKLNMTDKTEARRVLVKNEKVKDAMKMVRVTVVCNDPIEAKEGGALLRVQNDVIDTGIRYVPFGREVPFHIPKALYNMMKEKKTTIFVKKMNEKLGQQIDVPKRVNKYTIIEHEPLSEEEFLKIKESQEKRKMLEGE